MMPNRSHSLTHEDRARRCTGKHRWCDEVSARAGAIFAIEQYKKVEKLWVYRCPYCKGWHLTSKEQFNQDAITSGVLQ